jgi:uncharacterized protein (TIGR00299 family) protein
MARVMYFDCFSGAAGDMIVGALVDAGLPLGELRQALGDLGVGYQVQATRVMRAGISATHIDVRAEGGGHHHHPSHHAHDHPHGHGRGHDHSHDHGADEHRSLDEIVHLINHSSLSKAGKARAAAIFRRIAEAEAAIHQTPIERVHLHEVGAPDSIIDIVGAVFALEWFGIEEIQASPLNVGGGSVQIAHGTYPVPAPATLRLLDGAPIYSTGVHGELVTPTGAAIITTYARSFGPMPAMAVGKIGYGAGTKDREGVPNVLRVTIGERTEIAGPVPAGGGSESILRIECEIDDMNPQLFEPLGDRLVSAGALDIYLTPVVMKKGRPGTLVTVLAPIDHRDRLCDILFRETTTIGVRFDVVERQKLDRRWVEVAVPGGSVRVKVAGRGQEILNALPEFDDCLRVAQATGQPVKAVHAAALKAWLDTKPS